MIHTLTAFGVRIAHWSTQTCNATQNDGQVESSVDDFVVERGTVSTRVALVLRSVEVYPPVPRFVWHWPNCNLSLPSDRPKARSTQTEPNSLAAKHMAWELRTRERSTTQHWKPSLQTGFQTGLRLLMDTPWDQTSQDLPLTCTSWIKRIKRQT